MYPAPTDRKSIQRRLGTPAFEARASQGEIWKEAPELLCSGVRGPGNEHEGSRGPRRVCGAAARTASPGKGFRGRGRWPGTHRGCSRPSAGGLPSTPGQRPSAPGWRRRQESMVTILVTTRRLAGADLSRSGLEGCPQPWLGSGRERHTPQRGDGGGWHPQVPPTWCRVCERT